MHYLSLQLCVEFACYDFLGFDLTTAVNFGEILLSSKCILCWLLAIRICERIVQEKLLHCTSNLEKMRPKISFESFSYLIAVVITFFVCLFVCVFCLLLFCNPEHIFFQ